MTKTNRPVGPVSKDEKLRRREAIERVNAKQGFWRHVTVYSLLNLAFWVSWTIGGLRDEWVAPWPLVPTVLWGAFILYREHQLGGRQAIRHEVIDIELEELRSRTEPVYRDKLAQRPITFGESAAFRPVREFHLSEVIEARQHNDRVSHN